MRYAPKRRSPKNLRTSHPFSDTSTRMPVLLIMNTYVIKLLTEENGGLKFKVGTRADRLHDNVRSPDKGYSRVVTKKKINQEIAAMREIHLMGLCIVMVHSKVNCYYATLRY
jgi:hypothetical protein